ncbi:Pimeloyl-ACP methyl ester carboxylesterase [Rhodococcus rhodochrous J3]|uniref:Alpha/beta hydrolase n=2 Tax=Rhodococcus rhodochrous TaxID=1829 RepID=A0AA46WZZ2_RHORH|nr:MULTISPECIES: alpha/beta hydrolase [Rhodococcus]AYA26155.1 alpha/beta hydrolase [Rhodococcus rhodochrous]MBF4477469.1 alpha/beta hydrolase [Rhodococcus rhodochrous]MCB8911920.1 alpha/beta hydrolase [Rhodococcus rhodochrous]MCD2095649.1 alpha/beta hydrolase [Rhodococcus rhodochrous]MCD2119919.1 alpha/beta hydrolase [Rhodococcus rhodochrous]
MVPPRARTLRPVPDNEPRIVFRTIHGYRRAFRMAGSGPALLLVHGIGDDSSTWQDVIPHLAEKYTVIAPDLLGHGRSDKPRADYSVAAYANGMRDLLSVLGIESVTVIGHSLGGGVAMQFAYQFPHMVERLVLVASGGVTKDVHPALRLISVPIVSEALRVLRLPGAMPVLRAAGAVLNRVNGSPLRPGALLHDTSDLVRVLGNLPDPTAYEAYLRTLRAVVDWRGQVVTMLDRCYLTENLPVQLIWGDHDSVIPIAHGYLAHSAMPGSRLEVFRGSGHFPFRDDPMRFLRVVENFLETTAPLEFDLDRWRRLLVSGVSESQISGGPETRMAVLGAMGSDERSAT